MRLFKEISRRQFRCLAVGGMLVLALWAMQLHYTIVVVVGDSMLPTYRGGDLILVSRRSYENVKPKRGDIVVVEYRKELIIKRVIGLPGEEIEVNGGVVFINSNPLHELHQVNRGSLDIRKGKLGTGRVALLGDNRSLGTGQTIHAVVNEDNILGRVAIPIRISSLWTGLSALLPLRNLSTGEH